MRKTKIVSTLGPASNNLQVLRNMMAAGVSVVRLNFSHGTAEEKKVLVNTIRNAAKAENKIVGILADLQGPKIRISKFKEGKINLREGATFVLDAALPKDAGDETMVGIDYKELPQDVSSGDILLLDDGRLVLAVTKVENTRIICEVKVGGTLSNNKGINRQFGGLSAGALTPKDHEDLKTALSLNVDYIAISFVRSKADVEEAKDLIAKEKNQAGVIAKIERIESMVPETLREIIAASDGIMVARGDLGVEIGEAEVPEAQKFIIECAHDLNKPVITATQMMETMIHNVIPTRAEISDVANAILDGTDAVMLSAETATGDHPALVIQTMDKVCLATEKQPRFLSTARILENHQGQSIDEIIAMASTCVAKNSNITAVVVVTSTGNTALLASRSHATAPIFGLSSNTLALGKMTLFSNVYPLEFDIVNLASHDIPQTAVQKIKESGFVVAGDIVAVVSDQSSNGSAKLLTILVVT